MKKVIKKIKNRPAHRKKLIKKRVKRNNVKDKKISLKEGLMKTKEDKVILNISNPDKSLKSLVRDIFNLREARRQINFLGVDVKNISRHIGNHFIEKCAKKLNKIGKIIDNKKIEHKSGKYFNLSKEYNELIPHNFTFRTIDEFLINNKEKIKKEIRLLELLKSYNELRRKDYYIRSLNRSKEEDIKDNISIAQNESLNMSMNNIEKSVEGENHVNISDFYYEKALYETNYIFEVMKRESEEFQKIKKFLYRYSTENLCPYKKLELLELYKLRDRDSNFKEYEYLFWLGCETPHLYSILRHGLRFPMKLESSKIYNYGPGIMISHNPYAQLQYCIARNNIAYLFIVGNNGLKSKKVHMVHPNYPEKLKKDYDSVYIEHKIKLIESFIDDKSKKEYKYDSYCDYIVYNLDKIKLVYLAKIEIPSILIKD